MPEPTFETQVLVSLEEMKGDLRVIKQAVDQSSNRLDKHELDISALKSLVYKGLGASTAIAITLPIVIPFLRG